MPAWLKVSIAVVCLICVIAICIAPSVDLPDTTNRALQAAAMILWSLTALVVLVWTLVGAVTSQTQRSREEFAWAALLALSPNRKTRCVQRCERFSYIFRE